MIRRRLFVYTWICVCVSYIRRKYLSRGYYMLIGPSACGNTHTKEKLADNGQEGGLFCGDDVSEGIAVARRAGFAAWIPPSPTKQQEEFSMLKLWKRKKQILQTEYTQQEVFFSGSFLIFFAPFWGPKGTTYRPLSAIGDQRVCSPFSIVFFFLFILSTSIPRHQPAGRIVLCVCSL